jgi:Flp pilus assembly protein TadG
LFSAGGGLAGVARRPQTTARWSFSGLEKFQGSADDETRYQSIRTLRHHVATSRRGLAVKRLNLRRENGVAMTEFALILPIFMVIVAGLLGFGRVFFYWIQANHVASETARWAIVDRNPYAPTTLQVHAANSATTEFADAKVCITRTGTELGDPLEVTVSKPFSFVPIMDIGTITIQASSTMRVERLAGKDSSNNAIPTAYSEGCTP